MLLLVLDRAVFLKLLPDKAVDSNAAAFLVAVCIFASTLSQHVFQMQALLVQVSQWVALSISSYHLMSHGVPVLHSNPCRAFGVVLPPCTGGNYILKMHVCMGILQDAQNRTWERKCPS